MRQVLAIAEREFVERKLVIAAGVVLALLTLFTPWLPGVEGFTRGDVIGLASTTVTFSILFVGALVMGMTSINSDLSDRRFGFYFSRPVSGLSIWIGKVLGTLAVVVVTAGVTFMPSFVNGLSTLRGIRADDVALGVWLMLGVYFVGHVGTCAGRARSVWLLLDFAGVFLLFASGVVLFRFYFEMIPLHALGDFVEDATLGVLVVGILIATIASAVGVTTGRVETSRVHSWTSLTLWSLALLALAGVSGFSWWVSRSQPDDLRLAQSHVHFTEGEGEWMVVSGEARAGLDQAFAVGDGQHFLRVGSRDVLYMSPSRVVAMQPEVRFSFRPQAYPVAHTIVLADPSRGDGWAETTISGTMAAQFPEVSPSGNRVAIVEKGTVAVYSLPEERLVRALSLELDRNDFVTLPDDERLLVRRRERVGHDGIAELYRFDFSELDLATGAETGTCSFEASAYRIDPEGRLALAKQGKEGETRIYDLRDGTMVGSFEGRSSVHSIRWLADGLLAVPDLPEDGRRVVRLMDTRGEELRRVELGTTANEFLWLVGEARRGLLAAVSGSSDDPVQRCKGRALLAIDFDAGEARTVAAEISMVWSWNRSAPAGDPSWRTFHDCDGRIVRYDENLENPVVVLEKR